MSSSPATTATPRTSGSMTSWTTTSSSPRSYDGKPLTREHGGPARVIIPKLYAWKGAKFIRAIEFAAEDKLGFWEVRGYSNTADPWTEDRFS